MVFCLWSRGQSACQQVKLNHGMKPPSPYKPPKKAAIKVAASNTASTIIRYGGLSSDIAV